MRVLAFPATVEPGAFFSPTLGMRAASAWSSPSIWRVGVEFLGDGEGLKHLVDLVMLGASLGALLERSGLALDQMDRFLPHQRSKIIHPPILLADELPCSAKTFVISGFGAGLSWASGVRRVA